PPPRSPHSAVLPPPPSTQPHSLSLHDALPISARPGAPYRRLRPAGRYRGTHHDHAEGHGGGCSYCHDSLRVPHGRGAAGRVERQDRKSTRLNSSHVSISYAVFCLKQKNKGRR